MEGWIFFILSLLGLRQWLARIMPQSLVMAVGAGIGLFIAFIGLCELLILTRIIGDVGLIIALSYWRSWRHRR